MIVVIADDLTGAAEIGGIGLAHGLKVELSRRICGESDAELLIIDTDTRNLSPEKAGQSICEIAGCLKTSGLAIERIYKKTDSVLRGHVACELEALRQSMGASRVIFVPANPSKGRVVRDGSLYINGQLLSETDFANDPEYPAKTAKILKFQGFPEVNAEYLASCDEGISGEGIMVGQAETTGDLMRWAGQIDDDTIMAGAGEFFEAILTRKGYSKEIAVKEKGDRSGEKVLFVCGSSSSYSREVIGKAESFGARVCRMPEGLFLSGQRNEKDIQQWSEDIVEGFQNGYGVIMAIDRDAVGDVEFAGKLRSIMARTVLKVAQKITLTELFVEGGATASAIVDSFEWDRFEPCDQFGPGVVRMKVCNSDSVFITLKPGSYPWPESIWNKDIFDRS